LLVFEVQEKVVAEGGGLTADVQADLADLGVGLAIADFGADGCSISRLQQIPVKRLTISREWVQAIPGDRRAESLLVAVFALGQALGLTMLADGVEEDGQLDFLRAQGCDLAQGQRFGEPLSEEKVAALISDLAHRAVDAAHPLW
jgi:EAL domain-containing protein (putative c-di-GMP-specific phosphodiesterase class I)